MLVPETRPYLQGARLTAWELQRELMEFVRKERAERPRMPRDVRPDLPEPLHVLLENALRWKGEPGS